MAERILTGTATLRERREAAAVVAVSAAAAQARADPALVEVQPPVKRERAEPAGVPAGLTEALAPEALTADERKMWSRLAPHALAAHTLTAATADAFQSLVEMAALERRLWQRLKHEGWTVKGPSGRRRHPLAAEFARVQRLVDIGRVRFMLAPFGKPMEFVEPPPTPDAPADPWAQFDKLAAGAEPDDEGGATH